MVLGVHITNKLTWSQHTKTAVKRARQNLFPLRRLKRFGMDSQILKRFYSCTIESILTGCITAWYGNYIITSTPVPPAHWHIDSVPIPPVYSPAIVIYCCSLIICILISYFFRNFLKTALFFKGLYKWAFHCKVYYTCCIRRMWPIKFDLTWISLVCHTLIRFTCLCACFHPPPGVAHLPIIPCVFIPVFPVCLLPVRFVLSGLTSVLSCLPVSLVLFPSFSRFWPFCLPWPRACLPSCTCLTLIWSRTSDRPRPVLCPPCVINKLSENCTIGAAGSLVVRADKVKICHSACPWTKQLTHCS